MHILYCFNKNLHAILIIEIRIIVKTSSKEDEKGSIRGNIKIVKGLEIKLFAC